MSRTVFSIVLAIFISLFTTSCRKKSQRQDNDSIMWTKLPVKATVEIARTVEERARGLKFREYLKKDCGMYFMMDNEEVQSFWMKDTRIPLSIAFINSQNIIVSIKNMRPYDVSGTPSDFPAKYALEMERGWFGENNIIVGDKAVLEGDQVFFYRSHLQHHD